MSKILSDEQVACNMIKQKREYARKIKGKGICVPLKIDNTNLTCITNVGYNPLTENYTIRSHGIKCKKNIIYPTTIQKLKCANAHVIEVLNKYRENSRIRRANLKQKELKISKKVQDCKK